MSPDLEKLVAKAKLVTMTELDREAQRRSFAFGSAKIENEDITRTLIDEAAERLIGENGGKRSLK